MMEDWLLAVGLICTLSGIVLLVVALITGGSGKPDPFDSHCYRVGGQVAVISHGKSHDYLCVRGNKVLFYE